MNDKLQSHPRVRLFRSDCLEALTVISPRAFAALWACNLMLVVTVAWGAADSFTAIALFAAGLLIWSLVEYVMHRFLFHWQTQVRWLQAAIFVMHGNHHVVPNDSCRNLMPPIVSLPLSAAIWTLCRLALGPLGTLLFLGFIVGYVMYDSLHYACHQLPMRGRLLRQLRRHHIRHHYTRRDGNYAVTLMGWDRVFGTRIPTKRR